jgi:hypothetical protein
MIFTYPSFPDMASGGAGGAGSGIQWVGSNFTNEWTLARHAAAVLSHISGRTR